MDMQRCLICQTPAAPVFTKEIFGKTTGYYLCPACDFLFTERPAHWLEKAYSSAITSLDLGLVNRNLIYAELLAYFIKSCLNPSGRYMDFGGGYGLLTRIMRDMGYNFFRQDAYCENLFAKHFDVTDLEANARFELLTAFEVFEHLDDPMQEIRGMFEKSNTLFFSTEIRPAGQLADWYYLLPEIGQHISFYTPKTFDKVADICSATYYKLSDSLHVLTKDPLSRAGLFRFKLMMKYYKGIRRIRFNRQPSYLEQDFDKLKRLLSQG